MANAINPDDINPRTRVVGPITPISNADSEPTHFSDFAYGGLRSVANDTERDAIPAARRVEGMLVYVASDSVYFRLDANLITWTVFNTGSFITTFDASIGTDSTINWVLVSGTTDRYTRDFIHSLTSTDVEYVIYDGSNNFVFACVTLESNERLRITVNGPVTPFAGRITINKEGA